MTDSSAHPIQQLKKYVHRQHGNRIALSSQKLHEAKVKEAVRARGEANAYRRMLKVLDVIEEEGGFPSDKMDALDEEYIKLSKQAEACEEAGSEQQTPEEPDNRGWM